MAQQTAVEWLKGMLEWNYGDAQMLEITWENLDDLLEQAKQMEKEQNSMNKDVEKKDVKQQNLMCIKIKVDNYGTTNSNAETIY